MKYETILMYRTNIAFFMRFLGEIAMLACEDTYTTRSAKYIADEKPFNEEFVNSTHDIVSQVFTWLIFGRALLLLISFKYLGVTKMMCYYNLLMLLLNEIGLPNDSGDLRH